MGKKVLIYAFLLLNIVLLSAGCQAPYFEQHITVGIQEISSSTLKLTKGSVLEGYLTVTGGNNDIAFYINDPTGKTVLEQDRIVGRYDFKYKAVSDGTYTLYLNNIDAVPREVFFHYRTR